MRPLYRQALCLLLCWGSCILSAHADRLGDIQTRGVLRVGMSNGVPPFCAQDKSGQWVGSDVDAARLLVHDLGLKLEIVPIETSQRISAVEERKVDLVMSAVSITPEREQHVAFSVPYSYTSTLVASAPGMHFSSPFDLKGRRVGSFAKGANLVNLLRTEPGVIPVEYPDDVALMKGYAAGEFDILTARDYVIGQYLRGTPVRPLEVQFVQQEFQIAVAMPHKEPRLRQVVSQWVVSNLNNGQLNLIYRKHHSRDLPAAIVGH